VKVVMQEETMSGKNETDVVVIGSGVGGLAAAVTAAEGGAKVIVFEKQRSLGGTSNFFYGIFAAESQMQKERYIAYSRDEGFRRIMEYSHWRANARLVRAFVDQSASTIAWLQEHGVEFLDVSALMPGGVRTYHVVKGGGAAVVKALALAAKEKGVDLRTGTPVKKLLREGDRIAGVVVEENGEEVEVAGSAVVVASGGYANNKEWIRKYAGLDLDVNVIAAGNVDKTGDGIRMAWEVGAAEDGMGLLEMLRVGPMGPGFELQNQLELLSGQPDLWVDSRGERFCDESIAFGDSSNGNANVRHKEGYTWSIFDDFIKEWAIEKGIERGFGFTENPPGTRPVNFDRELAAALERGTTEVFAASSVEELAKEIGVDPIVLKATIDEYNGFCAKGHDDIFAKNQKYLRPLKGPRFYAVRCRTIFLGTMGGIKINERAEVIDKKGKPIPGLYAVGLDAGGMWGDSYPFQESTGAAAAFAIGSGRMAGNNSLSHVH
jgi:fumarate reductase flavoprotein subunit